VRRLNCHSVFVDSAASGGGTLSGSATVPAPFSIVSGGTYSLTANAAQAVVMRYSPTAAGTNNATVTFTGGAGATPPMIGAAYSARPPVAGFTGSPTNGAAPLTVLFTNLSSGATGYSWDFGGGKTSTVVNPANTPTNAGSYTVRLTAIGAGGTNRLARTNYIVVTPPVSLAFGPAEWLPHVGMRLTLLGNVTGSVTIRWTGEVTNTLSNWPTLIWFNNFIGSTQYIDSDATNFGRRFYRAVTP
jgi:PKD repeat protein